MSTIIVLAARSNKANLTDSTNVVGPNIMLNRKSSIDKYCLSIVFSMTNKLSNKYGSSIPSRAPIFNSGFWWGPYS